MKKDTIFTLIFSLLCMVSFLPLVIASAETFSIPAGTTRIMAFQLSWGDTAKGTISVSGGILHQGINAFVTDPFGNMILDLGTITGNAQFEFSGGFIRGTYELHLANPSWLSAKTVTVDYEIKTSTLMRYNYEIIGIVAVIVLAMISVLLYRVSKRRKMEKLRICPHCSQKTAIDKPICPYCGFDVSRSIRCKYCNTLYDRSLSKCPHCGAKNN